MSDLTTADNNGERLSSHVAYDPWGGEYPGGTTINNASGNADLGAYGSHGKLEEHATTKPLVLMGARPFSPTHGRFLSVDPVEGGCANAYVYVYVYGDSVNTSDLTGKSWWNPLSWTACGVAQVAGNVSRGLGWAAAGAGLFALTVGTGGTAAVVLGLGATAASGVQWGAGAAAHDRAAATNGFVGFSVGAITFGTWGAVSRGLCGASQPLSNRLVARAGMYGGGLASSRLRRGWRIEQGPLLTAKSHHRALNACASKRVLP